MATRSVPGAKPLPTNVKTPDAKRRDNRKVVALKLTPGEIATLDEWKAKQDLPFGSTKDVITFLYKTALRHNVQAVGLMRSDSDVTSLPVQLDIDG